MLAVDLRVANEFDEKLRNVVQNIFQAQKAMADLINVVNFAVEILFGVGNIPAGAAQH